MNHQSLGVPFTG